MKICAQCVNFYAPHHQEVVLPAYRVVLCPSWWCSHGAHTSSCWARLRRWPTGPFLEKKMSLDEKKRGALGWEWELPYLTYLPTCCWLEWIGCATLCQGLGAEAPPPNHFYLVLRSVEEREDLAVYVAEARPHVVLTLKGIWSLMISWFLKSPFKLNNVLWSRSPSRAILDDGDGEPRFMTDWGLALRSRVSTTTNRSSLNATRNFLSTWVYYCLCIIIPHVWHPVVDPSQSENFHLINHQQSYCTA